MSFLVGIKTFYSVLNLEGEFVIVYRDFGKNINTNYKEYTMGFKSNGIDDFDIDELIREQEEKQRLSGKTDLEASDETNDVEEKSHKKGNKEKKHKRGEKSKGRAGYSSSIHAKRVKDDEESKELLSIKKILPIAGIGVLVIAIIVLVIFGVNSRKHKQDGEGETTSYNQADNPLQEEAYEDISDVVKLYYEAKVAGNVEALAQYVDNVEGITQESLAAEYSNVNEYSSITCYTKNGLYPNTYVVFVYYELSIKNIATPAPGISVLYVIRDDETGNIYIHNGVTDGEVSDYITMISKDDDIIELCNDVNAELSAALAADADLKAFYDGALGENQGASDDTAQ